MRSPKRQLFIGAAHSMSDMLPTDQVPPEALVAPDRPTAGALLKAARQRQGLHVAALAVTLKVPVRKLEALEADHFDELPDLVFVRALAASVCRILKIDPVPVLAALPQSAPSPVMADPSGLNAPFKSNRFELGQKLKPYLASPQEILFKAFENKEKVVIPTLVIAETLTVLKQQQHPNLQIIFKNFQDLKPLSTSQMQAFIDNLIATSQIGSSGYEAVAAKALNSQLIYSKDDQAVVVVSLQLTKFSGDKTDSTTDYGKLELRTVKSGDEWKINEVEKKIILREIAEEFLGEFAWRKKKAAQYGSCFDKAIGKLAKQHGFEFKKDYLESL